MTTRNWNAGKCRTANGRSAIILDTNDLPANFQNDEDVLIQIRRPRNIKHHRLYWATLNEVVAATDEWVSADMLHRWVKYKLGYFEPMVVGSRTIISWKSTDFASMDAGEFRKFYDLALSAIADSTGIDMHDLQHHLKTINQSEA